MTGIPILWDKSELPGRHIDSTSPAGWLTRRLNPTAFVQAMLIVCLILVVWPASYGGRFGMVVVAGYSMEPTLDLGDAVLTWRRPVEIGDVILYRIPEGQSGEGNSVIHRVVGGDATGWITKGDNNELEDQWTPASADVLGVARARIPLGGRASAVVQSWLFISVIGGFAVLLLLWPEEDAEKRRRGRHLG